MNELELTVERATLDEIHAEGLRLAKQFYGDKWTPSLVRCDSLPLVFTGAGDVVFYEAR